VRGKGHENVEIHVDLQPPKWWALFGLWHWIMDDVRRQRTVTPETIRAALHLEREL
jgi:hypothetical protein